MTRIVTTFFAAVAFLMVVYWVVPGANPPAMVAVAPTTPAPQTVVLIPPPGARAPSVLPETSLPSPVARAPAPPAVAAPVPMMAKAAAGCGGDAIRCILEGKAVAEDPTDVTGSIVASHAHKAAAPVRPSKAVR